MANDELSRTRNELTNAVNEAGSLVVADPTQLAVQVQVSAMTDTAAKAHVAATRAQYTWPTAIFGFVLLAAIVTIALLAWDFVRGSKYDPRVCIAGLIAVPLAVYAAKSVLQAIMDKIFK